jgi:hypothetical protein
MVMICDDDDVKRVLGGTMARDFPDWDVDNSKKHNGIVKAAFKRYAAKMSR